MYQFIERDEQGAINTQQSILNCLNHALYQETAPQVQAFSQEEHGEVLVFVSVLQQSPPHKTSCGAMKL